jgi:phosphoacetylglucosamine mutase
MGIMITASHNPMKDNGIKIMDIDGGMLRMSLEKYFNLIVNEPNLKKAIDIFQTNIKKFFNNPPNDK